jgi:hypothetical protein
MQPSFTRPASVQAALNRRAGTASFLLMNLDDENDFDLPIVRWIGDSDTIIIRDRSRGVKS